MWEVLLQLHLNVFVWLFMAPYKECTAGDIIFESNRNSLKDVWTQMKTVKQMGKLSKFALKLPVLRLILARVHWSEGLCICICI